MNCRYFVKCNAPFCPLDRESLDGVWYPGEEICRRRDFANLDWIRRQKKIAKRAQQGYFTIQMLKRDCVIRKGIKGLDPDRGREEQLKKWLKEHPPQKKLTAQQKEQIARRLKQGRLALSPTSQTP